MIVLSIFLIQCGSHFSSTISSMALDPNPAVVQSGICTSDAQLTATQNSGSTLVSLVASFPDSQGNVVDFEYDENAISTIVSDIYVPPHGTTTIHLELNLEAESVPLPAEGTILVTGVGAGGTVQFVGVLTCEE